MLSRVEFLLGRIGKRSIGRGTFDMGVKTFWPRLWKQLARWQRETCTQGGDDDQTAAPEATDAARWATALGLLAGDVSHGQRVEIGNGQHGFGLTTHADHPEHGDRHGQPEAFGPARMGHFGLLPMPAAPFGVFVAGLDPCPQAIPCHIGPLRRHVGHDQPRIFVALVPAGQQRTCQLPLLGGKTPNRSGPALPGRGQHLTERAEHGTVCGAILALTIDPEQGMPAQRGDGMKEPLGIQATVGGHDHLPVGGDTALQLAKQRFPVRTPGTCAGGLHDMPRHWDGAAPDDHMNGQDGESLAER